MWNATVYRVSLNGFNVGFPGLDTFRCVNCVRRVALRCVALRSVATCETSVHAAHASFVTSPFLTVSVTNLFTLTRPRHPGSLDSRS